MRFNRRNRRTGVTRSLIGLTLLAMTAIIVLAVGQLDQLLHDPDHAFLWDEAGAEWIKLDADFNILRRDAMMTEARFRRRFATTATIEGARLNVRAMKQCVVFFDDKPIHESSKDLAKWKQTHQIDLPSPLPLGTHEVTVLVRNRHGPPVMLAYSDELDVRSDDTWEASPDGREWTPAWPASRSKPATISRQFPSAPRGLRTVLPWLAPLFAAVFIWTRLNQSSMALPHWFGRIQPEARHVYWALLVMWLVLAMNNIVKLPNYCLGFDGPAHLEYISFIVENRALPLATDGLQMFQSPLFYIVSAPVFALFSDDATARIVALRIIPLVCGLAQIMIVHRSARLVFPENQELQSIATVIGGLMPMSITMSQLVGNEPLTGCFTALTILLALPLLMDPASEKSHLAFVTIGAVWGLALLSKFTPVLLAPPLAIAVLYHCRGTGASIERTAVKLGLLFGTSLLVCGWYYARNWIELGKPFVSGWDPSRGIVWWQDPGYRTVSQFFSFGESLMYPIYAGVHGVWDAIYSTVWLDGFNSGIGNFDYRPPWNADFMVAGALLALVPTILMIVGAGTMWSKEPRQSRSARLFALACLAIYFIAILGLYLRLPIYSTAKGSYTLGLLPCYAIMAAAGAEPFLRHKITRAFVMAWITCWAVNAYLSYFIWNPPT